MLAVCLIIKSCPEIHVVFFTFMFFSTVFLKLDGFCFLKLKKACGGASLFWAQIQAAHSFAAAHTHSPFLSTDY